MSRYAATTDERGAWDAGDKVEAVKMVRRRLNVSLPMAMKIMQGGDTEPSEVETLRASLSAARAMLGRNRDDAASILLVLAKGKMQDAREIAGGMHRDIQAHLTAARAEAGKGGR